MKRRSLGAVAGTAIALVATVRTAAAQLPGIPYGPVETGLGISVAADYGKPDNASGGGTAYGLTGGIGFSRFGLSASVGAINPAGNALGSTTSFGGRFGMKLIGGGLNPISLGLQIGGSSTSDIGTGGNNRTTIQPGAWVKVSPPLLPLKPWGQVYYLAGSNLPKKEVRFTVGANFNLLLGLGIHGAYDWGQDTGKFWGIGAHFTFRVPGLGVPGVPGM